MTEQNRTIPVRWHCRERVELSRLVDQLRQHVTIKHVLDWCLLQTPKLEIDDMITQDEYTHDFIVHWDDSIHLVYGTT